MHHFKKSLFVAMLFALAACESPGELRQKSPDLDEVTNVPAEHLAGCIGDKLEDSSVAAQGRLSSRPTEKGYTISVDQTLYGIYGGATDTIILVDISSIKGKTRVQLFTHFLGGNGGVPAIIRKCL